MHSTDTDKEAVSCKLKLGLWEMDCLRPENVGIVPFNFVGKCSYLRRCKFATSGFEEVFIFISSYTIILL
jgi:hypothetical protein